MYSPKVAVVDSGVDTQNQEIMQHVIQGFSFQKSAEDNGIVEEGNFDDVFGHGTNCIDCILQFAEQTQFYPIKIVNELGKTTSSLLLAALKKCRELQVDLICLSLSVTQILDPAMEKELRDICNDLEKQGKIICTSECNNAKNTIPAIYKSVIGVGKLLPDAKKKILVDRAANVQVLADISPIFVAGKSGRYNFFKGTSKGNAYVAGILARAMQTAPNIKSVQEALNILEKTDDPLEEIDLKCVGKLQTDEVGQMILEKIHRRLLEFGCTSSLGEISRYPFLSQITGVNFFNFYDFISGIYGELKITKPDYHAIKVGDACTLYNLVEHLRRNMCYEEKECCFGADTKV